MSTHPLLSEPDRIEEPQKAQEYWDMLSRVASTHQPVIVRRGGADATAKIQHPADRGGDPDDRQQHHHAPHDPHEQR